MDNFQDRDRLPPAILTHCQNALSLSQELGIPLVKDCEELLAKIQATLAENPKLYNNEENHEHN